MPAQRRRGLRRRALAYGWQDVTTDRTVTIAGTDQTARQLQPANISRRGSKPAIATRRRCVGVTPYAALQATTFYLPTYAETAISGSNHVRAALRVEDVTTTRGETRRAKSTSRCWCSDGVFTLKAKAAWAHDWNTDRTATPTFQALPGATFTVNGAQPSANGALVSLAAEMGWRNGWSSPARRRRVLAHHRELCRQRQRPVRWCLVMSALGTKRT